MIEYEFYCAIAKISTVILKCIGVASLRPEIGVEYSLYPFNQSDPKLWPVTTCLFAFSHASSISLVLRSSARTSLSTNQIQDDNQLRLSYSHLPALQTLCLFYLEALLAKRDVSSVLIGYCNYFSNDSIDWLLWLLFSVVEKLTQEPIIRVVKKSSTIPSSQWSVRSAAHLDHP